MPRTWTEEQKAAQRKAMAMGHAKKVLKENSVPFAEGETLEELQGKVAALKAGLTPEAPHEVQDKRYERQEQELQLLRKQMMAITDQFKKDKGNVPLELLDPDDVLEKEIVLFSNSVARTLDFKWVNGHMVPTPSGKPYKFTPLSNNPVRNAEGVITGMKITSVCKLSTKRDRDWVLGNPEKGERPHQDYGVFFWRSATEALSISTRDIELLQRQITYLNGLSESKILSLAQDHGVPIQAGKSSQEYVLPLAKVITAKNSEVERDQHNAAMIRQAQEVTSAAVPA